VAYAIALVRTAAGLLFWQHGLEKLFGFAGARPEPTLWAIRGVGGILETIGGPLIAFVVATEALLAYAVFAQPRTLWPVRNGGNEALLYAVLGVMFVVAGAGAWSIDARRKSSIEIDLRSNPERRRLRA
jgi:putative oxidoreductase